MSTPPSSPLPAIGMMGAYLDEVGAAHPRRCHEEAHGHPAGGGTHHIEGMRELLTNARAVARQSNPDAGFFGETFAEPYLDVVDAHWAWAQVVRYHHAPIVQAVYHDYTVFIGDTIWPVMTPEAAHAQSARDLSWGAALGNGLQPINSPITPARMRLARYRLAFRDYLVLGEMLRPGTASIVQGSPSAPVVQIVPGAVSGTAVPINQIIWSTSDPNLAGYKEPMPAVLVSQWRYDGHAGIVIASTELEGGAPRFLFVPINRAHLGFGSGEALRLRQVDIAGTATDIGILPGQAGVRVRLERQSVVLLEVVPHLL